MRLEGWSRGCLHSLDEGFGFDDIDDYGCPVNV